MIEKYFDGEIKEIVVGIGRLSYWSFRTREYIREGALKRVGG